MKAFCLWAAGYSSEEMQRVFRNDPTFEIVAGKWKVARGDIHSYFTDDFWHNLSIYLNFQAMGLPYAMGWADHPKDIVKLIRTFKEADAIWYEWKQKNANSRKATPRR